MRYLFVLFALTAKAPLTAEAYSRGLVQTLAAGAKQVDRYIPPANAKPKHTVHMFLQPNGSWWYVTDGLGFVRQPNSAAGGPEVFVELATWSDRKDERIADILSQIGESMHAAPPGAAPLNAWNYDTINFPEELYGLRYFVLRPGAEVKMPRADQREQLVSVFTVIPLTPAERAQVAGAGRERARAWVEKRAAENPAAMLTRWKMR